MSRISGNLGRISAEESTDDPGREELERRARASQDRFEAAFHGNAAAMVIAIQADLRILDVNQRWLQMFGAVRTEVIGRTAVELELISEADAQARIAKHRAHPDGHEGELVLRTRNGSTLTVHASARPIQLAEGACTLTTLIDITGRKQAEEAFAVAFSASPAGMILVNSVTNTVVAVNNRLLEMTRYERDDLVGRRVDQLSLVQSPSFAELVTEVQRSGRLDAVEIQLRRKGDESVSTLASTETITLHDTEHRLTVFTDITARKRIERRLRTQHEVGRLLAEASELDAAAPRVLEAMCRDEGWDGGALWLPADDGSELRCRGTWYAGSDPPDLAQITRSFVPGSTDGLLARVLRTSAPERIVLSPDRSVLGAAVFAIGLKSGVAFPILRGSEVLGVVAMAAREDKGPLDSAERALLDAVGHLLGLFVERTRAETRLRELNLELERRVLERTQALASSNRDLEAFSSSVSHDLRAPLRTIQGFSLVLLEDFAPQLPEEAKRILTRIHASGTRLKDLVDDVLAFSRLGRDGMHRIEVDLDAMVGSVIDELIAGRGLGERLELRVKPLGTCHADPSLLRSVWVNLIDNALKYTRDRERIEIEIGCETRGSELVYYVRDNGVGFDPQYADRLFGVFQRLHGVGEFEGTGIGLANVRRIVERHHGRVAARTELGRGSQFEFTLGADA